MSWYNTKYEETHDPADRNWLERGADAINPFSPETRQSAQDFVQGGVRWMGGLGWKSDREWNAETEAHLPTSVLNERVASALGFPSAEDQRSQYLQHASEQYAGDKEWATFMNSTGTPTALPDAKDYTL